MLIVVILMHNTCTTPCYSVSECFYYVKQKSFLQILRLGATGNFFFLFFFVQFDKDLEKFRAWLFLAAHLSAVFPQLFCISYQL